MELSELEVLRATGLFLTQIEVKDSRAETLAVIKKTVRITGAGLYGWYIWVSNLKIFLLSILFLDS